MTGNEREHEIRPPTRQKMLEWSAALSAAHIGYRHVRSGSSWVLLVPREEIEAARGEIRAYEDADAAWPPPARDSTEPSKTHDTWAAVWVTLLLVWFYAWMGPYSAGNPVAAAGSASAANIAGGELWRTVTALTMHSGIVHLAGNALCLLVIGHAVCRMLGGGLGWLVIFAAGVAGNLATALLATPNHVAVGASTAGFGALGVISAYQSTRCLRRSGAWRSVWSRTWIPLCAGLALLGFIGTGEGTDLAAHGFGFVFGAALGVAFGWNGAREFPEWGQRVLELWCIAILMLCWRAAFIYAT